MKTIKLSLIFAATLILGSCAGNTAKKERITDILITSDGVGNINFFPGNNDPKLQGYTVTKGDDGIITVTAGDGETVITRERQTITVTGYEFKTEEGIHVGMPIGEAVKLLGDNLQIQQIVLEEGNIIVGLCRHFADPGMVEEYDNIVFWASASGLDMEKFMSDSPSNASVLDAIDPDSPILKITVTELI